MALIDLYRRYMYGQAPQDMGFAGGQRLQQGTQGLFGTGGQAGKGGLLTTFEQPDTSGLFNVLSNPYVGIGASLFGAGQRGQTLGMAAGESALQGLQFSETAARLGESRKKRELIKEYADQVPQEDKELFELNPEGYIVTKLKQRISEPTLSKEILAVYNKMKGLSGEDFDKAFAALSNAEKSIYRNKIEGNQDIFNELVKRGMEAQDRPVILDSTIMPEKKLLKQNQLYQIKDKFYRWNGSEMIPAPAPK